MKAVLGFGVDVFEGLCRIAGSTCSWMLHFLMHSFVGKSSTRKLCPKSVIYGNPDSNFMNTS